MLIYIIGFTRAGKSRLAQELSAQWQIPAFDTDDIFCQQQHTSIDRYVETYGWAAFRELESRILLGIPELLGDSQHYPYPDAIVACGGGIVELVQNREFLKTQRLIWLHPPWSLLQKRNQINPSALTRGKTEEELFRIYQRRVPLFRECLSFTGNC